MTTLIEELNNFKLFGVDRKGIDIESLIGIISNFAGHYNSLNI
jgi:hypothetical protein